LINYITSYYIFSLIYLVSESSLVLFLMSIRVSLCCNGVGLYAAVATITIAWPTRSTLIAASIAIQTTNELTILNFVFVFYSIHMWYIDFNTNITYRIGLLWFFWALLRWLIRRLLWLFWWILIRGFLIRTRWCGITIVFEHPNLHSPLILGCCLARFFRSWWWRWYRVRRWWRRFFFTWMLIYHSLYLFRGIIPSTIQVDQRFRIKWINVFSFSMQWWALTLIFSIVLTI
jgi:hypothetical protein